MTVAPHPFLSWRKMNVHIIYQCNLTSVLFFPERETKSISIKYVVYATFGCCAVQEATEIPNILFKP